MCRKQTQGLMVLSSSALLAEGERVEFRRCIEIPRDNAAQKVFDFCRGAQLPPGREVVSDADIDIQLRANANSACHPSDSCKIVRDEMAVMKWS